MTSPTPKPKRKLSPLAYVFLGIVTFYRLFISPLLGASCRYQPTCSAYGLEAISHYGALKGGWLTLKRIGRCHPWGGFGYDPVPKSAGPKSAGPKINADDKVKQLRETSNGCTDKNNK